MQAVPPVAVTFRFPPPGFFINSPMVRLLLDDQWLLFHGSFTDGFRVDVPVAPGAHRLTIVIETGFVNRTKHHWLNFAPYQRYDVLLEYSRFWGSFSDPKVAILPG